MTRHRAALLARRDLGAVALTLAAILLYAALIADGYALRLLAVAGCQAMLAIGYQRLFGGLGVLSLAQGAFFALGAYAVAILTARLGLDHLLALPAAIGLAATLAVLVAPAVIRLASHYAALATLAVAQLVLLAAINLESLTGGANGLAGLPPLTLAGFVVPPGLAATLAIWLAVAAVAALAWRAEVGLAGLRSWSLREAPFAAAASGIDAAGERRRRLVWSAAAGGLAGGLYAPVSGVISPDVAEFPIMVGVLAMTVIGGRLRLVGALWGALLITHLPEWFRFLEGWYLFAVGAAMLAVMALAPQGLAGLLDRLAAPALPGPPVPPPDAPPPDGAPSRAEAEGEMREGPVLEGRALARRFGGVVAVAAASLDLRAGEIVGLVGPNGAGKTTLINLLAGADRPDAGQVRLAGRDVTALPDFRRARLGIARTFQATDLPNGLTALETAAAAAPGDGLAAALDAAARALDRVGLPDAAHQPVGTLPPGARRRLELARALAARPRVLILDEPTSGLDAAERALYGALLRRLRADGLAVLAVDHDIRWLAGLADRLICLEGGRVAAAGRPDDLRDHPALRRLAGGRWP